MKKKNDPITISQLVYDFIYLSGNVLPRRLEFLKELENEPGMPKPIKQKLVTGGASRSIANIEQRIAAEKSGSGSHSKPKIIGLTCGKCGAEYQLFEGAIHRRCGLNGCDGSLHFIG